ncbi:MAG: hypothetical protein EFT35_02040, partial [Methanophagales archaeon ANME-1-THS]
MALSIISVVKRAKPPWERNYVGRPCWDPKVVAICLFMKVFTARTYDGIEAYLKTNTFVGEQLKLTSLPGHSVIARSMTKMPLSYIRTISRLITFQMRRRGMDVAADSSGFSLKTSNKWFDIRIKRQSSKKDYFKLHIVIDVETNVILQFTITDWRASDSREF